MRFGLPVLAVLALAACEPAVPDSAAGVGFNSYDSYSAQRERALREEVTVRAPAGDGAAIAAQTLATLGPAAQAAAAPQPQPQPQVQGQAEIDNPGISDEQSFAAVSSRETIQSDRERLEAQREQYKFIEPQPLPGRTGASGPNIVEYAISAPNRVGEPRYRRAGRVSEARFQRNCAKYASPDRAQEAFLKAGGPERDRLGIDPDGDGFACYWDPTPFRAALR
ncbi:hypothetical protein [Rhodovulum marinum]|uniref:Excalibur calcium-binding domain-containing protein n=1 Tax=Rhodovulum marinum TaxID=320662 RepID=A0A4V2SR98_9RHOB|nr:hypothetical protein [Rhodovulum marinum]TCP41746.1 hypothetical protein EV662_10489 [Rhodovulum marinum]